MSLVPPTTAGKLQATLHATAKRGLPPLVCDWRDPTWSESRMREICTSGSMSGRWKRGTVRLVRHRQTKGPATDRPHLTHRATARLYHRGVTPRFRARHPQDMCKEPARHVQGTCETSDYGSRVAVKQYQFPIAILLPARMKFT
jgi:hypothetical protein